MNQNDCKKLSELWQQLIQSKSAFESDFDICQNTPINHSLIEKKYLVKKAVNSKEKLKKNIQEIKNLIIGSYPEKIELKWEQFVELCKENYFPEIIDDLNYEGLVFMGGIPKHKIDAFIKAKNDNSGKYSYIEVTDNDDHGQGFYIEKKNLKKYMGTLKKND